MNKLPYKVWDVICYQAVVTRSRLLTTSDRILFQPRLRAIRRLYLIVLAYLVGEECKRFFLERYILMHRFDRQLKSYGYRVRLDGLVLRNVEVQKKQ